MPLLFLLILPLITAPAYADNWQLCKKRSITLPVYLDDKTERPVDDTINIHADQIKNLDKELLILNGNTHLVRKDDEFFANQLTIKQADQSIKATGDVIYKKGQTITKASSIQLEQLANTGIFNDAELFSAENHSTIKADKIIQYGDNQSILNNISYTSCDPENPNWEMRAEKLQLNQATGRGLAKNMQLRLFDIPFFYFPIFSFPIDDRRVSGFLYPSLATSNDRGTEVSIPWYWNIAPQADATFTNRYMSKRGWQFNSEWRLLTDYGKSLFYSENLDDQELDADRWFYHFAHEGQLHYGWNSRVQTYNLADAEHLDDLGSEYHTDDDYLRRFIGLNNNIKGWDISLLFQDYEFADQDANDTDAPFQLKPRVTLSRGWNASALNISGVFSTEYTQFDHETRFDAGSRWVNQLSAEKRFGSSGWYIKPKLAAHLTEYNIDNRNPIRRNIPITSIDSGLFFDRYTKKIQQTLEPRLYLLYIPFENQNTLPDYDTSNADNSYNRLFQANRFNGNDRIGDTKQASIGLTSRIYDLNSGAEKIRMQIGQSFYFEDRQVFLNDNSINIPLATSATLANIDTSEKSNIFTGLRWYFRENWQLNNDIAWRNRENNTSESRFRLQYRRDNDHLFYVSHSYDKDILEQADINGRWKLSSRWTVLGKYLYDLRNKQNINRFVGVEYENCCLAVRLVQQRLLEDNVQENNFSIQLSLKGLSSFGRLSNRIAEGINGYDDGFDN